MGQGNAALPADPHRQRALRCLAQREHLLLYLLASFHSAELLDSCNARQSSCRSCSVCSSSSCKC